MAAGAWTALAELFAFAVETAYFALLLRRRRAWRWSLVANAASFSVGIATQLLFGFP